METMLPAEALVEMARLVMVPRGQLVDATDITEEETTMVVLAIKFDRMPLAFKLRALVEGWSRERIIREMY